MNTEKESKSLVEKNEKINSGDQKIAATTKNHCVIYSDISTDSINTSTNMNVKRKYQTEDQSPPLKQKTTSQDHPSDEDIYHHLMAELYPHMIPEFAPTVVTCCSTQGLIGSASTKRTKIAESVFSGLPLFIKVSKVPNTSEKDDGCDTPRTDSSGSSGESRSPQNERGSNLHQITCHWLVFGSRVRDKII